MAATPTVYVICDNNCKFEGMTKEQILAAIMQAVEFGEIKDVDAGFVTTIKTINGKPLKFFVGEQSQFDALSEEEKVNLFAIITNDTTKEGIIAAIEELQTNYNSLINGLRDGTFVVKNAENAKNAADLKTDLLFGRVKPFNAENAANAAYASRLLFNNYAYNFGSSASCDIDLPEGLYQIREAGDPYYTFMLYVHPSKKSKSTYGGVYGNEYLQYDPVNKKLWHYKTIANDGSYQNSTVTGGGGTIYSLGEVK